MHEQLQNWSGVQHLLNGKSEVEYCQHATHFPMIVLHFDLLCRMKTENDVKQNLVKLPYFVALLPKEISVHNESCIL